MTSAFSCKTPLAFALFTLYSKVMLACFSRCLLTSYFCIPVPYDEKDNFFFFFCFRRSLWSSLITIVYILLTIYISGKGNGNPLQYSCLENPMGRGACPAMVHGVARVRHDLASKPPPPSHITCLIWLAIIWMRAFILKSYLQ